MKRIKFLHLAVLLCLALVMGYGCAKKTVGQTPKQAGDRAGMSEAELAAKNLAEAKRVIMSEKIYFAFDSFDLSSESRAILKRKADVLKGQPNLHVLIAGHCDERGTQEYNLALGDRRARAAQKYLVLLGVSAGQLETVSYGEERPAAMGANENAWAQNRRDEFKAVW